MPQQPPMAQKPLFVSTDAVQLIHVSLKAQNYLVLQPFRNQSLTP